MKKFCLIPVSIILLFPTIHFSQVPDTLWTKHYHGLCYDGFCHTDFGDLLITNSGDFIIAGTITAPNLQRSITLLKTNSSGEMLWGKNYITTWNDQASGLVRTDDGGFAITGTRYDNSLLLWKINQDGDTIWTKSHMVNGNRTVGIDIIQHTDGGYLVAGYMAYVNQFFLITKFSNTGNLKWSKFYGEYYGMAKTITKTSDNNYVAVGHMGAGPNNLFIVKIDSAGKALWQKGYRNHNIYQSAWGNCVQETSDGGLIITGYGDSNIPYSSTWLLKTDVNGDTLWTKYLLGSEGRTVNQTNDGGFIVSSNLNGHGIVIKTDSIGNVMWTKTVGGNYSDYFGFAQQCSDLGYIICGESQLTNEVDPDIWLIKLSPKISEVASDIQFSNSYLLFNNYPNPFNPTTLINYSIPERAYVTLKVFDVLGNEVKTLMSEKKEMGTHSVKFDARNLCTGIYFYQLRTGDYIETKKMILIK